MKFARRIRAAAILICLLLISFTVIRSLAQGGEGGPIRYGDTRQGQIDSKTASSEEWDFVAASGDVIAVDVVKTSGTLDPVIVVLDDQQPFAGAQAPAGGGAVSLSPVLLPHEGSFVIRVSGRDQTVGEYEITLTRLSQASTTPTIEPTSISGNFAGVIGYGQTVRGDLGLSSPRQAWRLNGNAGFIVDISMESISGDLDSSLALLAPTGEVLAASDSQDDTPNAGIFAFQLPFNGDYTILARTGQAGTEGAYTLTITVRGNDPNPAASVLSFETPIQGRLTAAYPRAVYRLGSTGAQALNIELNGIHQLVNVRLLTTSGVVVREFQGLNPLLIPLQLDGTGPYFVEISAINYEATSDIDFRLLASRLRTNVLNPAALRYGETYTESLVAAPQYWIFSGRAGDSLTLDVAPQQPSLDASVLLIDPQDVVNYEGVIGTGIHQTLTLARAGVYEVIIRPGDSAASATNPLPLTYNLRLSRMVDAGFAAVERGALPDAGVSGTLAARGADAYWIDGEASQILGIVGQTTDAPANLGLLIQRPDGSALAGIIGNRSTQTVLPRVVLDRSGRYRVIVFNTSETPLTYTLTYTEESGGILMPGRAVKAAMLPDSGTARWTLSVPAGALLNVRLTNLTPVTWSPTLYVITPSGLVLASATPTQNVASLLGIAAPITGTYTLLVAGKAEQYASYRLEANFQQPFGNPSNQTVQVGTVGTGAPPPRYGEQPQSTAVTVSLPSLITRPAQFDTLRGTPITQIQIGSTRAGEITSGLLRQAFQFSVLSNSVFTLKVEALDTETGSVKKPYLMLFDGNGAMVAEQFAEPDGIATLTYQSERGGVYTAVVSLGLQQGRFLLSLTAPSITTDGINIEAGTPLMYGDKVESELTTANTEERYFFFGNARNLVDVTLEHSTGVFDARLEILTTDGQSLAQAEGQDNVLAIRRFELPDNALYVIRVQAQSVAAFTGGRYTLRLNLVEPLRVRNRGGGILSSSGVQMGFLSRNDPEDTWLFTGQQGEQITLIAAGQTENAPLPLTMRLLDTSGQPLAVETTTLAQGVLRLRNFILPQTGLYRVSISGGNTAGTYTLSRESAVVANSVGIISYAQTVNGLFTPQRRTDTWAFTGTVGDSISVSLRYVRGDRFFAGFQVFSENGLPLATGAPDPSLDGGARVNIVLPFSGTFTIFVANPQEDYQGAGVYALSLVLEDTKARSMGTQLHSTDSGYGDLYTDDASDTWLFHARNGEQVRVLVSARDSFLHPQVELRGIGGNLIALANGERLAQVGGEGSAAVIQSDGVYSLTVTGINGSTGAYAISLAIIPPQLPESALLRYGDSRNGVLGDDRPSEVYTFSGTQGDVISAQMVREPGSSLDAVLELRTTQGRVLARSDAVGSDSTSIQSFRLPATGDYQLAVVRYLASEGSTSGRYTVSLSGTPFVSSVRSNIDYGQVAIGRISDQLPEDRLSFKGKAGDVVTIAAEATSGNLDLVLRLETTTGEVIAQNDDASGVNPLIDAFVLPADGEYILVIARVGSSAGNYELVVNRVYQTQSAATTAGGTPLIYGQRVVGTLESNGALAQYSFTGSKDDLIVVRLLHQADEGEPTLTLNDAAGNVLATGVSDDGQTVIDNFRVPADGAYTINLLRASNARSQYMPYALTVDLRAATVSTTTGGVLEATDDVVGTFTQGQTTHYWLLTAQAGTRYSIQLQRLTGNFTPSLLVVAPNGQNLAAATVPTDQPGALITSLELPISGIYSLIVLPGEMDSFTPNQYRLIVQPISSATATPSLIEPGRTVTGSLSANEPTQRWIFSGVQGQAITAQVLASDSQLTPTLTLIAADGLMAAEGVPMTLPQGHASVIADFPLPQAGDYTLVVSGGGIGEYRLTLDLGNVSTDMAAAQQLSFDQLQVGVVRQGIDALWALDANAEDVIDVGILTDEPTLPAMKLELRTLSGEVVATSTELPELYAVEIPSAGRYILALKSSATASYSILAQRRQQLIDFPGISARSLTPDTPRVDTITDTNLVNLWRFSVKAGQSFQLTAERSSGDVRLDLTLFGPDGYIASATMKTDGAPITLSIPPVSEDGEYTLAVSRWLVAVGSGRGNYRVTLTLSNVLSTPVPSATPTADSQTGDSDLAVNANFELSYGDLRTGSLTEMQPRAVWLFSGKAGDRITIVAVAEFAGKLLLRLFDPNGRSVAVGNAGKSPLTDIQLLVSGNYTIEVGSDSQTEVAIGDYGLRLLRNLPGTYYLGSLPFGQPQGAQLSATRAVQAWYFNGKQGEVAAITVQSPTPGFDPLVQIVSSDGVLLAAAGSQVEATLPATGEFICLVSNAKQQLAADYHLILSSAIAPTGGGRIYIDGITVDGEISDQDFTDQWRITTDASEPLTFALTALAGDLQAEFVLYDANGNIVFVSTPDSLPEQIQLPDAGTYILLVSRIGGALGSTHGRYTLAIQGS